MHQFFIDTWEYYKAYFFFFGFPLACCLLEAGGQLWMWFHIRYIPTTRIADLTAAGEVEIKGHVRAVETIPNADQPVVYRKIIHEYKEKKKDDWQKKDTLETLLSFQVDDGSGKITVSQKNALVDIADEEVIEDNQSNGLKRTRNYYLKDSGEVYVMGRLYRHNKEWWIGKKFGTPFIIADRKEENLLLQYGRKGSVFLGGTILITMILFGIAYMRWQNAWDGKIVRKYTTETSSDRGARTLQLKIKLNTGYKKSLCDVEWNSVRVGDYLIKRRGGYHFEIIR